MSAPGRQPSLIQLGVLAALLVWAAPFGRGGHAQAPPPSASGPPAAARSDADESEVVAQLEVVGRRPGPALWRVRRGDSEVVILGGLSPIPHLLQWDTIRVEHALEDSEVLFLSPNKVHVGLFDAAELFLRQGAIKAGAGGMTASLDPLLRERFERVIQGLHLDPKRYQPWKPAVAGLLLLGDFRRAAGLSSDKPGTTVARMARAAHAEVRTVGEFKAKPLFDAAAKMSSAQNQVCLSAAIDDVEREAAHARPAAAAWAVGDLKTVRLESSASLLDSCLLQLPNVQAVVEQGTRDAVQTITQALNRPGRSVAVIDLTFLLRRNGVLDRLKAEGDQITIPAG